MTSRTSSTSSGFRPRPLATALALALVLPVAGSLPSGTAAPLRGLPVHRSPTPAATLAVDSCADDGSAGTLRNVVAVAASGDTVDLRQLACSTITLTQGEIAIAQDDLTLSGPGAANLRISGGGASGVLAHRGTGTLTIDGLALADGRSSGAGGCVYSAGSVSAHAISVTGCTTDPQLYQSGGGLYVKRDVEAVDSTISGNYGYHGGGIWTRGDLTLTSTTVADNAGFMGGGIWTHGDNLALTGSTISGNHAGFNSGGLLAYSDSGTGAGTATITNSTLSGNVSDDFMGGAYVANMVVRLSNSTVAFNRSARGCSGLQVGGRYTFAAYMDSSLLSNNAPTNGVGCDFWFPNFDVAGSHNLVVTSNGTLPPDTIRTDPLLLQLADNGGPTRTHAPTPGSVAMDAGSNPLGLASDQRGEGYARVHGSAADIGAFELQQASGAPGVTKLFTPGAIQTNGVSTLTITLSNGSASPATLTSALTDALPAPLVLANPPGASTTCTQATLTAVAGAGSLSLGSGAQIPAQGSCAITATVIAHAAGTFTNVIPAGALQTDAGESPDAAIADLTVTGQPVPPTLTKAFAPSTIVAGGSSVLTITLANSRPNAATLATELTDALPPPLVVADPPNAATTCLDATVTAAPGAGSVTLGSGTRIPGGTCTVSVSVTTADAGTYLNVIAAGALQTDFGSNPDVARAGLTVTPGEPADRIFADGFDD